MIILRYLALFTATVLTIINGPSTWIALKLVEFYNKGGELPNGSRK